MGTLGGWNGKSHYSHKIVLTFFLIQHLSSPVKQTFNSRLPVDSLEGDHYMVLKNRFGVLQTKLFINSDLDIGNHSSEAYGYYRGLV